MKMKKKRKIYRCHKDGDLGCDWDSDLSSFSNSPPLPLTHSLNDKSYVERKRNSEIHVTSFTALNTVLTLFRVNNQFELFFLPTVKNEMLI